MNKFKKLTLFAFLCFAGAFNVLAQNDPVKNWHLLDHENDRVYGISMERTYQELLKNKKSVPVIVAIMDSGIDTLHEDLKTVLWHSPEGNSGWNFLGNSSDPKKNVTVDSYERVRFYFRYSDRFANLDPKKRMRKKKQLLYQEWLKSKNAVLAATPEQRQVMFMGNRFRWINEYNLIFKKVLKKEEYTLGEIQSYMAIDDATKRKQDSYIRSFAEFGISSTNKQLLKVANQKLDSLKQLVKVPQTAPKNLRAEIVGDNELDLNDKYYGNSNVSAGHDPHGTHVAGIIGAVRGNNIGIDGVADHVQLMMLRVTPKDGDEHDKDVALAIRYAVDHGAKIINMSFGKDFSQERKWVEDAIRYANKNDVLIVKAAGNDSRNVDSTLFYPTAKYLKKEEFAPNVITVGASSYENDNLVAGYSNYGVKSVDVFAPGSVIYSTVTGSINKYNIMSGTSMASPVVAGLAAVLRSYFPRLSAKQVKAIIEGSVTKIDGFVNKPGSHEKTTLDALSKTGGIVNAYKAVKMAETFK
ncbi:Subtilase family protein [Pedobacter sp. ok626]|uniref:S8 family serine peptidase n=1 Tax=Pedobacter sp. ok626 TaxID=1761882 RepID=UPI00088DEE76|nr:S8 family serine peptidase [Pedobacter sp. ok626]SDL65832.1 Subtilase family protein [Pedobacter sp. ok626]